MNLLHHLDTWFERYLALSAVVAIAWCVCVPRLKRTPRSRGTRVEEPNFVVDDLLADAPAEILAVDERDRQFFAIVNAERWFADGAA